MTIITCVEDRWGQAFHRRRLSRDRTVCARVLELAGGAVLRMSPYSVPLFPEGGGETIDAREDYLAEAAGTDACFVELEDLSPWLERADKLVLFRWNRAYPSDLRFPAEVLQKNWVLSGTAEFPGSSHEKITEEWYEKA